ncbi:MAG: adenylate/guanylate cyclase domain-containing protein [Anaerolineales bacterium]
MAIGTQRSPFTLITKIGKSVDDSQDIRLQKSLLVYGSFMFIAAGALWGIFYILFHETLAGMIPLSYAIVSCLSVVHFALTRRYRFFRASQLILILLLPFLLMISLGGFINSSAVILWSFICPLGALLFAEHKQSYRWLIAYLALLVLSGFLQSYVGATNHLTQRLVTIFFVLNIGVVSSIVFLLLHYFVGQKELAYRLLRVEQDRSESLLLNVLPREIATRLKAGERIIADHHPSVSIMFADLVGFTPLTNQLSPTAMVELLNEIYSHFDSLIEKHGVEKIRTIGDNYMIAAGLPRPRADHAQVMVRLALEMNAYIASLAPVEGRHLSFRFGINSGPVIAGVIGHKKFAYDVWGDTANIASRMESQGVPGKIQITQATYEMIKADFICEPHGSDCFLLLKG